MKKPLILITDDEPNIRLMLRTALETVDCVIDEAADGKQALEAIDRDQPDLMVLDLSMPVMDGMSVLKNLKERSAGAKPPVVVLTAYGSVSKAVQAVRLGARDFLEKPITPEDLRSVVAEILSEARSSETRNIAPTYDMVLTQIRESLRADNFTDAESLLMKAGSITAEDAEFLNLAGVFHEAMGRRDSAKRYYGKAIRADPQYAPAQQNMRRVYELTRFGQTTQPVALGDEPAFEEMVRSGGSLTDRIKQLLKG